RCPPRALPVSETARSSRAHHDPADPGVHAPLPPARVAARVHEGAVRYYGFLSPSAAVPLPHVKARIEMASGVALVTTDTPSAPPAALRCRHCGGALRFSRLLLPGDSAIGWLASLARGASESATPSAVAAGP